jgi:uncharacterized membrane protein
MCFGSGIAWLVAPSIAVVALPELAFDTLSNFPYQHLITTHYSMPLVAVLVSGTVYAVSRLQSAGQRRLAVACVTLCALWSCILWGDAPFSNGAVPNWDPSSPAAVDIRALADAIPPSAAVSADENYVANLADRSQVYLFPNPFSQSYYGNPEYNGSELPQAAQIQYILLPSCVACDVDLGVSAQGVLDRIMPQFKVVGSNTAAVLYERKAP